MNDDAYNLMKLYEDYTGGSNQSNYPSGVTTDTKNSYNTSLAGPGNGQPANTSEGGPSTGDVFEFPSMKEMTKEQVVNLIKRKLKAEISIAEREEKAYALKRFKRLYSFVVDLLNPESDEE